MKQINRNSLIITSMLFFSLAALADTVVLKDGTVLQGTFKGGTAEAVQFEVCLLYTSPSPRDRQKSRMPSSA